MKRIAFALAIVAALSVAATAPSSSQAGMPTFPNSWSSDWSPSGKQLVFTTDRRGNDDLWLMTPSGRNQRPLTRDRGDEWSPAWSPDGSQVAFVSDRDSPDEIAHIYVVGADGTHERQVTTGSWWDNTRSGRPDGTKLVFARSADSDERRQLFVVNADGTNEHQLLADDQDDIEPTWSPDGTRIAFVGGDEDSAFIDVVAPDGTGRVRLTTTAEEYDPSWSPDGRRIAFHSYARRQSVALDDERRRLEPSHAVRAAQRGPLAGVVSRREVDRVRRPRDQRHRGLRDARGRLARTAPDRGGRSSSRGTASAARSSARAAPTCSTGRPRRT